MNDGTDAFDLQALLDAEPVPGRETSTTQVSLEGVEVQITLRGKWMLVPPGEIQEFDDGEQLARFLWDECETRHDSLVLLYHLRMIHLVAGPMVTCGSAPAY